MGDNKGFAKSDMERVGLFSEPGYITLGDNYKGAHHRKITLSLLKFNSISRLVFLTLILGIFLTDTILTI